MEIFLWECSSEMEPYEPYGRIHIRREAFLQEKLAVNMCKYRFRNFIINKKRI